MSALGAQAAEIPQVKKVQVYNQTSATGATLSVLQYPYGFSSSSPSAATVTPPGISPIALTLNSNNSSKYQYQQFFQTQAARDAAFPNGAYSLSGSGFSTINFSLTGDLYPVAPQVVGGTWQNGVLVVDPTQDVTINFNTFATYASAGQGGHEDFQLQSQTQNDNVNIDQSILSVSIGGGAATPNPFTSYTIPAGTLRAGSIYQGNLAYDTVGNLITSPAVAVSLYTSYLTFYVVAKSATAIPAPTITTQPSNQTAPLGGTAGFSAGVSYGGAAQPNFVNFIWYFNGQQIDFSDPNKYTNNGPSITIKNLSTADVGVYGVTVIDGGGRADSQTATLAIGAATAPTITTQPQSQTVNSGTSVTFSVGATGTGPLNYQWYKDNLLLTGATGSSYNIASATTTRNGSYIVTVSNSAGSATSNAAILAVGPVAPVITIQPSSQTVATGSTVVFSVSASGIPSPTYQWSQNTIPILGATNSRLVITGAASSNQGTYACTATNSAGSATSNGQATLAVTTTSNPGRLVNLSILTQIRDLLTVGVVVGGSGVTGNQSLLIRAVGPTLGTTFGYPGAMPDPAVTVIRQAGSVNVGANAGWKTSSDAGLAALNVAAATGAFPLLNPSLDSVVVASLPPVSGGYSIQVKGSSNDSGAVIAEIYDNTPNYTATSPRLVNLSSLKQIAVGTSLTMGFVLGGSTSKTVLIRAAGPALIGFGYSSSAVMADPKIVLQQQNNGAVLATNSGWGGDAQVTAVTAAVGGFAFTDPASKDSAVILTLPPVTGGYSATVSSASGGGGNVIVEVYEVP